MAVCGSAPACLPDVLAAVAFTATWTRGWDAAESCFRISLIGERQTG